MVKKAIKEAPVMQNNDRKVLAEHFAGKKFNDKLVADFCTRNKIPMIDAESVEDFIYQVDYDKRLDVVLPATLVALAKMQYAGEYLSEQKRKEISDANDDISREIAQIFEDNGIEYREIGFLQSLVGDVANVLADAHRRLSNMCATVLAEMAQEKLGDPLTVKVLAGERAQIADRKATKLKEEEPEEAKSDEKDRIEVGLPETGTERAKELVRLEDNVGVIISASKNKAIVAPYKKGEGKVLESGEVVKPKE